LTPRPSAAPPRTSTSFSTSIAAGTERLQRTFCPG
jgi:hypothetical protein